MDRQEDGWTDYRKDRHMEKQTPFYRNLLFWPCPGAQQEKPQKKSQSKHCLTTKQCKSYWLEIDMVERGQDATYVRNLWSQVLAS